MTTDDTETRPGGERDGLDDPPSDRKLALMVVWLSDSPSRAGELAVVASGATPWVVGRGPARPDDPGPRLLFAPSRGGASQPLTNTGLSRVQLLVRRLGDELAIESLGKAPLAFGPHRTPAQRGVLREGDTCLIGDETALMCVRPPARTIEAPRFGYGEPDEHGLVGESERAWNVRDELRFYAARDGHVLVLGPSGAGKELCARALHDRSPRASGPFVARNAATLPVGIIDAELFGNAKNYPNAGMRERPGLVGEADGGTLFLDEIGELPEAQQAHLLRVLDAGEYHRLGEDRSRKANVRLVAATNRPVTALKPDLLARFKLRVTVPGLDERREDIPILTRHLLRATARRDDDLGTRFFLRGEPQVDAALVLALVSHPYTGHVRELETLLISAMAASRGNRVKLPPSLTEAIVRPAPNGGDASTSAPQADLERVRIEQALETASGNVSVAGKLLGLTSRDAL
ncbi:MAG TPA: sigma 54-interacting transcriptional regulator, partial [Labilithrix sp.]|nr:sigma 54-interacting transcriptional regulator [Labilithrix sp.]